MLLRISLSLLAIHHLSNPYKNISFIRNGPIKFNKILKIFQEEPIDLYKKKWEQLLLSNEKEKNKVM